MTDDAKCYAATPAATLEKHITDSNVAKNEAEWWAHHEITRLREENARLRAALEFYADSKNYSEIETGIGMFDGMSERDCCGRRAREALGVEE